MVWYCITLDSTQRSAFAYIKRKNSTYEAILYCHIYIIHPVTKWNKNNKTIIFFASRNGTLWTSLDTALVVAMLLRTCHSCSFLFLQVSGAWLAVTEIWKMDCDIIPTEQLVIDISSNIKTQENMRVHVGKDYWPAPPLLSWKNVHCTLKTMDGILQCY